MERDLYKQTNKYTYVCMYVSKRTHISHTRLHMSEVLTWSIWCLLNNRVVLELLAGP